MSGEKQEVPVGTYSYGQELRDMLRAAYRRFACRCHDAEIERLVDKAPFDHAHQRFFEMVDRTVREKQT